MKLKQGEILSFHSIEKRHLPYFIGWIVIFTWLYSCFLPNGIFLFLKPEQIGGFERLATYVWLIACPAITFFIKATTYIPRTIHSVGLAIICLLGLSLNLLQEYNFIFYVLGGMAIGHIFASCCYGFFMVLNNTEKFYSMILGILVPKILLWASLVLPIGNMGLYQNLIYLCCIFVLFGCCLSFARHQEKIPQVSKGGFPKTAYILMAVVFLVLALNDVLAPLTIMKLNGLSKVPIKNLYFFGIIMGIILCYILQKKFRVNISMMLNISFAFLAIGLVLVLRTSNIEKTVFMGVFSLGTAYSMGMINIYYLAGIMAKKFKNITFYRVGIILSAIYYFTGFVLFDISKGDIWIVNLFGIVSIIIFFVFSPIVMNYLFAGEWIDDSYREDVTEGSRLENKMREYKLSNKEMQLGALLIEGNTLRQCAAIMKIAYPTANTYQTSLYRKLNINSKTQLLLMFEAYH